jgi:hypothetical protein
MQFVHGDMSFDVPEGWVDASQIGFLAPADKSLANEFAKAAAAAGAPIRMEVPAEPKSRANFALSFRPWFLEMDPKDFVGKELRAMLAQVKGVKLGELEMTEVDGAAAAMIDVEIQLEGMAIRQLHLLWVTAHRIVHFCGTTGRGDFDKHKDELLHTAKSIRFAPIE